MASLLPELPKIPDAGQGIHDGDLQIVQGVGGGTLLAGVRVLDLAEAVAIVSQGERRPGEIRVQRSLEHRHGVALYALVRNLQSALDSFRDSCDERDSLITHLLHTDSKRKDRG
jgi:hypothetical protein